ncbi:MAG: hypothetical protein R2827_08950 [Bdellovibrionales bacterium]
MKKKKEFSLMWVCEPFADDPSYFSKRMFGGLAIYVFDKMQMVFMESPGDFEWKGEVFDFEIWNGLMVCTSREFHESLKQDFSYLVNHPVLGKWLYLPMTDESFESTAEGVAEAIVRGDERIGIIPGQKKRPKKKTSKKAK